MTQQSLQPNADASADDAAAESVVIMPFTYSITVGVAAGVVSYVAIMLAQGRAREIGAFMWGLTAVFAVFFALDPIRELAGRALGPARFVPTAEYRPRNRNL